MKQINLSSLVPRFVRKLLVVARCEGVVGERLRERGVDEIHGVDEEAAAGAVAPGFDSVTVSAAPYGGLPFPQAYFDGVLIDGGKLASDQLAPVLENAARLLSPDGWLLYAVPSSRGPDGTEATVDFSDFLGSLGPAGLVMFFCYPVSLPDERGGGPSCYLFVAVSREYDPIGHADKLVSSGRADWALELLANIPEEYQNDPQAKAAIMAESLLCLLVLDVQTKGEDQLSRFANAQAVFYTAIASAPTMHPPYLLQSKFWHRLGNDDMASRVLRSILEVVPEPTAEKELAQYANAKPPVRVFEEAPEYVEGRGPGRVLLVTHPRPHYGLDVLFDGLCSVLGDENVVDFPHKPFLHGEIPPELANYPCSCGRRGRAHGLDEVCEQLREGAFDVVLFGDLEFDIEREAARRIAEAAGDTPLFLTDAQDEAAPLRDEALEYLGISDVAGHFKREMLTGVDYGPNTFPFPFAYPDSRAPGEVPWERPEEVFWAGHREFGLRRLYLEHIEAALMRDFNVFYPQEEYAERLLSSRIGINIFGKGFDTVRYWELPAHGCMLLAERLPIEVPHDFRDGESAVFFDDTRSLEERLRYCLARPEEVEVIARNGREHFLKYHTASARARQTLAWIQQRLMVVGIVDS